MPDQFLSGVADAAGAAVLTVRPRGSRPWRITQVSPEARSAPGGTTGTLRKNGRLVAPFVPQGDAVGGDPPVELQATDELTIEWTGADPGNIVAALVFYEEM